MGANLSSFEVCRHKCVEFDVSRHLTLVRVLHMIHILISGLSPSGRRYAVTVMIHGCGAVLLPPCETWDLHNGIFLFRSPLFALMWSYVRQTGPHPPDIFDFLCRTSWKELLWLLIHPLGSSSNLTELVTQEDVNKASSECTKAHYRVFWWRKSSWIQRANGSDFNLHY